MKLSVFSPVFNENSLEEALIFLNKQGVKSIEWVQVDFREQNM